MTIPMDWIRLRCRCDEDTDCMLWNQMVSKHGAPITTFLLPDGRKPTQQLRRVVWQHRNGPIPDGLYVTYSCKHSRCLRHLELVSRSELNRRMWSKPDMRARMVAASTKASRANAKVDEEIARQIRNSSDSMGVEAQRYGISQSLVAMIRRGERWRDETNPFARLLA